MAISPALLLDAGYSYVLTQCDIFMSVGHVGRMTRSRCHLEGKLVWAKETMYHMGYIWAPPGEYY